MASKVVSVILLANFILLSSGVNGQLSSTCNVQVDVTPAESLGDAPSVACTLECDQEQGTIFSSGVAYYDIEELRNDYGLIVKAQLSYGEITSCETVPYTSNEELDALDEKSRSCEPQSLALCPADFAQIGDTCYYITPDTKTQSSGSSVCAKKGGAIAVIDSEEEVSTLASLTSEALYTGLRRSSTNTDEWVDASGNVATFTNWADGQPNNLGGVENCAVFRGDLNGEWSDGHCGYAKRSICESDIKQYLVPACPEGQYQFGGSCYLVSDSDLTSADAETFCADQGGALAFITSQEEQDFLAGVLTDSVTIGLSSVPLYTSYADSASGDCLQMSAGDSFAWTDLDCSSAQRALCEIPNTL